MTEATLPSISHGELLAVLNVKPLTKVTKAPPLYTEGTLLMDMESPGKFLSKDSGLKGVAAETGGLGTAATRHACIEGLKDDKYLELRKKNLIPTPKGDALITWLELHYPDLTDVAVTAEWEQELAHVAKKGGGLAFEQKINAKVASLVATLRTAPPLMGLTTHEMEPRTMSNDSQPRNNPPTAKMQEFAKKIADMKKERIPDEVMSSFDACKKYLDDNKETASRPSEKQLTFANSIALRAGVTIPAATLANGKDLSAWIDANK